MSDIKDIENYIRSKKYDFIESIEYRPNDDTFVLYVQGERLGKVAKNGMTSNRQLSSIERSIKDKFRKDVSTIFTQSDADKELEKALLAILNLRFDDRIDSLYFSRLDGHLTFDISIHDSDGELPERAEEYLRSTLGDMPFSVDWTLSKLGQPSWATLLRIIKIHQPISFKEMMKLLVNKYTVTEAWLRLALDNMRKKGFIHWEKSSRCYELTSQGLSAVPSGARRSSSDVDRALALRSKKW